jgi:hypothetical protein
MMVIFDLLHSSTTNSRQPDLSEGEQTHFLPTFPPYRILLAGLRGSWDIRERERVRVRE